ncbi:hypothetical protein E2320_014356 [Naja naja]|nr:hypothetical protein E2320_014356 [Naja naja]
MLLLLLFAVLLCPRGAWGMHKAKCLLILEQGEVDPQNYYKQGDYFISIIVSAMKVALQSLSFNKSPSTTFSNIHSLKHLAGIFSFLIKKREWANYDDFLHSFLQGSQFHNHSIEGVYLDEKGDLTADLDTVNWIVFPNKSVKRIKSGSLEKLTSQDLKFSIDQKSITQMEMLTKVELPFILVSLKGKQQD